MNRKRNVNPNKKATLIIVVMNQPQRDADMILKHFRLGGGFKGGGGTRREDGLVLFKKKSIYLI